MSSNRREELDRRHKALVEALVQLKEDSDKYSSAEFKALSLKYCAELNAIVAETARLVEEEDEQTKKFVTRCGYVAGTAIAGAALFGIYMLARR